MDNQVAESPTRRSSDRRRVVGVTLACVLGFAVCFAAAGAWRLSGVESVAGIGVPVAIPGGTVQVDEIEHVEPAALGAPLPSGSHAVQVSLTVTADGQAPTIVSADDFAIEGTGVLSPIKASQSRPLDATVPRGASIPMVLVFAVPDQSTALVMTTPGDGLLTADHDDHPGDQLQ